MKFLALPLILSCFCLSSFSQTQKVKWGVKGGMAFTKFTNREGPGYTNYEKLKPSVFIGGTATFALNPSISFQPGLLFVFKGGKGSFDTGPGPLQVYGTQKVNITYLEVPINLLYTIPNSKGAFFFGGGTYYALGIDAYMGVDFTMDGDKSSFTDANFGFGKPQYNEDTGMKGGLKRSDFGVNLLTGYRFNNGLGFNLGYGVGILNISQMEEARFRNRILSLGVGFDF
ncbi:MAG: outer membrane beta-barrel protein [Bacteroidota bacterium]